MNDNLTNWTLDLNASPDEIELKIYEIEWRGDENGRETYILMELKVDTIYTKITWPDHSEITCGYDCTVEMQVVVANSCSPSITVV